MQNFSHFDYLLFGPSLTVGGLPYWAAYALAKSHDVYLTH